MAIKCVNLNAWTSEFLLVFSVCFLCLGISVTLNSAGIYQEYLQSYEVLHEYLDSPRGYNKLKTLTQVIKHSKVRTLFLATFCCCCECILTVLLLSYSMWGQAFSTHKHPRVRHRGSACCLSWTLSVILLHPSTLHLLLLHQVDCVVIGVVQSSSSSDNRWGSLTCCHCGCCSRFKIQINNF